MKSTGLGQSDRAIRRFMNEEKMTHRVFFYDEKAAFMIAGIAAQRGQHMRMGFFTDGEGNQHPYTRQVDLTPKQHAMMEKDGFFGMINDKYSEVVVGNVSIEQAKSVSEWQKLPPVDFVKEHLKEETYDGYSW